jgi:hypothetical protein
VLAFLLVHHLGGRSHAQRMLPRILDDAATALESSRFSRRLPAAPSSAPSRSGRL